METTTVQRLLPYLLSTTDGDVKVSEQVDATLGITRAVIWLPVEASTLRLHERHALLTAGVAQYLDEYPPEDYSTLVESVNNTVCKAYLQRKT